MLVEGAEPGDTLAVHLVDLTPAQLGRVDADPVLRRPDQRPHPTLQEPLPERAWIYEYDSATKTLAFSAQRSDFSVALPSNPMLGTVGVAPDDRREVRTALGGQLHGVQL